MRVSKNGRGGGEPQQQTDIAARGGAQRDITREEEGSRGLPLREALREPVDRACEVRFAGVPQICRPENAACG